ncbi:MAG: hypothetical protein KDA83_11675 [Planctomycetales bacterium]|nr:hypothetical protein [Planctomycetales bacterium]
MCWTGYREGIASRGLIPSFFSLAQRDVEQVCSGETLVTSVQVLSNRRDQLLHLHQRGLLTESETSSAFLTLLLEADDDEAACELCCSLPGWFQAEFRERLEDLHADACYRAWGAGVDGEWWREESRGSTELDEFVQRIAPRLLQLLD